MTLALDTDFLVNWLIEGTPLHEEASFLVTNEVRKDGALGLVPQVLYEFVHVGTDPRRFERPFSMDEAIARARSLWDAPEVVRIVPGSMVPHRSMELLSRFSLGRKRILDTALAATLEAAGVRRLATFNGKDYQVFPFLEIVTPS